MLWKNSSPFCFLIFRWSEEIIFWFQKRVTSGKWHGGWKMAAYIDDRASGLAHNLKGMDMDGWIPYFLPLRINPKLRPFSCPCQFLSSRLREYWTIFEFRTIWNPKIELLIHRVCIQMNFETNAPTNWEKKPKSEKKTLLRR